jgi:hypothetical protein
MGQPRAVLLMKYVHRDGSISWCPAPRQGGMVVKTYRWGGIGWWKDGKPHRDGGPAFVGPNGYVEWLDEGKTLRFIRSPS